MTKVDFLQIVLLQRTKLVEEYQKPGWNRWVLIGSFASLLWVLLTQIQENSFILADSIYLSIAIFLTHYALIQLINSLIQLINSFINTTSERRPRFINLRSRAMNSLLKIFFVLGTLVFIYIFILNTSTNTSHFQFILFHVLFYLVIAVFIMIFILSYVNFPINIYSKSKAAKKVSTSVAIVSVIIYLSPLILIYPDLPAIDDYGSIKFGLIIFSFYFVIVKLISAYENNLLLNQIDDLIDDITFNHKTVENGESTLKLIVLGLQFDMIFSNLINEHLELTKSHQENCELILIRLKELAHTNDKKQQSFLFDAIKSQFTRLESLYKLIQKNKRQVIQKLSFYQFSEQDNPEYQNINSLITKSEKERTDQLANVKNESDVVINKFQNDK